MSNENNASQLPFGLLNYVVILASVILICLGFILMNGEKFIDATEFSMALKVCPFLIVFGFIGVIVGIMIKPKNK